MAIARSVLVNPSFSWRYQCLSRCVRRAHFVGEGLTCSKNVRRNGCAAYWHRTCEIVFARTWECHDRFPIHLL